MQPNTEHQHVVVSSDMLPPTFCVSRPFLYQSLHCQSESPNQLFGNDFEILDHNYPHQNNNRRDWFWNNYLLKLFCSLIISQHSVRHPVSPPFNYSLIFCCNGKAVQELQICHPCTQQHQHQQLKSCVWHRVISLSHMQILKETKTKASPCEMNMAPVNKLGSSF